MDMVMGGAPLSQSSVLLHCVAAPELEGVAVLEARVALSGGDDLYMYVRKAKRLGLGKQAYGYNHND